MNEISKISRFCYRYSWFFDVNEDLFCQVSENVAFTLPIYLIDS